MVRVRELRSAGRRVAGAKLTGAARYRDVLAMLDVGADVLVPETGASPREAYNGATAIRMLAPHVRCTVLCSSDPYAVVGVVRAFDRPPDLVADGATNTEAGVELVGRLTGLEALNLLNETSRPRLRAFLEAKLGCRFEQP